MSETDQEALQTYAREVTAALTNLAGGGSEFFAGKIGEMYKADISFCVDRINESKNASHERYVRASHDLILVKAQRDKVVEALKAVVEGCKTLKMVSKGAGGMTIEAQTRRSVYHNVPAWPIECASYALDEIGET